MSDAETALRLYCVAGALKFCGRRYEVGQFVELQTEDRRSDNFLSKSNLQRLIRDGVLKAKDAEPADDTGDTDMSFADFQAWVESDGEVEAMNRLAFVYRTLKPRAIRSLRTGISRGNYRYRSEMLEILKDDGD